MVCHLLVINMSPGWLEKGRVIYHWSEDVQDLGENAREKWKYGIIVGFLKETDRILFAMISSPHKDGHPKVKRELLPYTVKITRGDCRFLQETSYVECFRLSTKYGSLLVSDFHQREMTRDCGTISPIVFDLVLKRLLDCGKFSKKQLEALNCEIEKPDYSHMYP